MIQSAIPKLVNNNKKQCSNGRYKHVAPEKHKIIVIGDSNDRGFGQLLQKRAGNKLDVSSFYKPNVQIKNVLQSLNSNTHSFNRNDFVVVLGGSNYFCNGTSAKALRCVVQTLEHTINIKMILATVPYRFDDESKNVAIYRHNFKLYSLASSFNHIMLLNLPSLSTNNFTSHDLHPDNFGKTSVGRAIMNHVFYMTNDCFLD